MDAQALGGAVVDGDEDEGVALGGHGPGLVGAPHLVGTVGDDPSSEGQAVVADVPNFLDLAQLRILIVEEAEAGASDRDEMG